MKCFLFTLSSPCFIYFTLIDIFHLTTCYEITSRNQLNYSPKVWPLDYKTFSLKKKMKLRQQQAQNTLYMYKTKPPVYISPIPTFLYDGRLTIQRIKRNPYGSVLLYGGNMRSPVRFLQNMMPHHTHLLMPFNTNLVSKYGSGHVDRGLIFKHHQKVSSPYEKESVDKYSFKCINTTSLLCSDSEPKFNNSNKDNLPSFTPISNLRIAKSQRTMGADFDLNSIPTNTTSFKIETTPSIPFFFTPASLYSSHSFFTLDDVVVSSTHSPPFRSFRNFSPITFKPFEPLISTTTTKPFRTKHNLNISHKDKMPDNNSSLIDRFAYYFSSTVTPHVTSTMTLFKNPTIDFNLYSSTETTPSLYISPRSHLNKYSRLSTQIPYSTTSYLPISTPYSTILSKPKLNLLFDNTKSTEGTVSTTESPERNKSTIENVSKLNASLRFRKRLRGTFGRAERKRPIEIAKDHVGFIRNTLQPLTQTFDLNKNVIRNKYQRSQTLHKKTTRTSEEVTTPVVKRNSSLNSTTAAKYTRKSLVFPNRKNKTVSHFSHGNETDSNLNKTTNSDDTLHNGPPKTDRVRFQNKRLTPNNIHKKNFRDDPDKTGSDGLKKDFHANISITTISSNIGRVKQDVSQVESAVMTISNTNENNPYKSSKASRNFRKSSVFNKRNDFGNLSITITEVPPLPIEVYFRKTNLK